MGSGDLCGSVQNCPEQSVLLMLVSGSWDQTICVWDVQIGTTQEFIQDPTSFNVFSSASPSISSDINDVSRNSPMRLQCLIYDLYFQKHSGFIVGPNNQLLLWVPPSCQPFAFHNPQQPKLRISAHPVIDLSHMSHGLAWHQCFSPSNI